jgi:thiol-disulfide isomerase/thioredoxin
MRRSIVVPLLLVAATFPLARATTPALAPGDPIPELGGRDIVNAKVFDLDWGTDSVTLINFWATWCEPCRKEMPTLQELHERFGQDGLRVLGVTREELEYEDLQEFLYSVGVTFKTVRASRLVKAWGGMGSLPTTFLVDRHGRLLRRYVGFTDVQSKQMARDVEAALGGKPLEPMVLPEEQEVISEDTVQR